MAVSFDVNFWTILLFSSNFALAIFSLLASRNRVRSDELIELKISIAEIKVKQDESVKMSDLEALHKRTNDVLKDLSTVEGELKNIQKTIDKVSDQIFKLAASNNG